MDCDMWWLDDYDDCWNDDMDEYEEYEGYTAEDWDDAIEEILAFVEVEEHGTWYPSYDWEVAQ